LVRRQTGGDDLQNFAALRTRSTVLAWTMTIFMLSLAGLPPLAGFFGKFYLFSAAFRAGDNHGLLWLVAIALFGSFVSLYYYLMVLKAIFVDQGADTAVMKLGLLQKASISLLGGFVLILGLIPAPLVARIAAALS
jgi:NADH:ubiquinone oxidoreductase subunit 2 (chain N)